jgi:hypothetical protein
MFYTFEQLNIVYGSIKTVVIDYQTTGKVNVIHKETGFPKIIRNHYKFSKTNFVYFNEKIIGEYVIKNEDLIITISGREV